MHCGKRNLHKVFSHDGATISDYIWRLRLARCRSDLVAPSCAWKSITEIAYSWGFNSSTHFSKAFKETFGISPRLYRMTDRKETPGLALPAQPADERLRKPTATSMLHAVEFSAQ